MNHLWAIFSVASIVISLLVSRLLTRRIIDRLSKRAQGQIHFLATPAGGAFLFALVFVVVWCAVSFLLVLPWLVVHWG